MSQTPSRWPPACIRKWQAILARRGLPATEADALRVLDQLAPGLSALVDAVGRDRVRSRALREDQ